jgi:hypothetical protein
MIKNPLTYEIMTPQSVGVPSTRLVLGKHSGRHALGAHCEALGFRFDRRELDQVYRQFVVLADEVKAVEDRHLLDLIARIHADSPQIERTEHQAPHSIQSAAEPACARVLQPGNGDGYLPGASLSGRHSSQRNGHGNGSGLRAQAAVVGEQEGEQEDYLWGV